jgi:hypothetical protein
MKMSPGFMWGNSHSACTAVDVRRVLGPAEHLLWPCGCIMVVSPGTAKTIT